MFVAFGILLFVLFLIQLAVYQGERLVISGAYLIFGLFLLTTSGPSMYFLIFLLAYIAAMSCKTAKFRSGRYTMINACVLGLGYMICWLQIMNKVYEIEQLAEVYQPRSITEMLNYESDTKENQEDSSNENSAPTKYSSNLNRRDQQSGNEAEFLRVIQSRVNEDQYQYDRWRRHYGLQTLMSIHQGAVSEFQVANGFGVGRMGDIRPNRDFIEIPHPGPVEQPKWTPPPYDPDAVPPQELASASDATVTESSVAALRSSALDFHVDQIVNFINTPGFGYIDRDARQVIGFQSHGFLTPPKWSAGENNPASAYEITRLELISLLKHDPPAVYQSDNLPNMEELKSDTAPTRELDAFERNAVGRLREGEDLIVAEDAVGLRMVGALRAVDECLQCHQGRVGKLLGGFTYRLRPAETDGKQPPEKKQRVPEKQKPLS